MSVILAVEHPQTGEIAIGADGQSSDGGFRCSLASAKLMELRPGWIVGAAGQLSVMRALRRLVAVPPEAPDDLAAALRTELKVDGWTPIEDKGEPAVYNYSLVLVIGDGDWRGVWDLCSGGSVERFEPGYPLAVGSGREAASAAFLRALELRPEWSPYVEVEAAIRVAAQLCTGVGGKISVRRLEVSDARVYAHAAAYAHGEHGANGGLASAHPESSETPPVP